jgi:tetratricopeptide (TPR) repeat protein/glycosyltransferase involved in cell wall biosynthesis
MRYSLDDLSRKTSDDHRHLIFLISLPRSGSTLLQRVLNGNKEIHTASESWFMLHPLHAFKTDKIEAKYDHNLAISATQEFISQIPEGMDLYYKAVRNYGLTFYNRALEISGKRYYLDKTPRYYTIIPELLNTFPDARFILLLRNPMAVLSSVLQTWFNNVPAKLKSTSNYRDLIEGPNALIAGIEHLKHKAAVVYYEDLVINPQSCIERICNYLDISFDKEMLEYGGRKPPIGKFGDNVGIHQHERPVSKNINKWISNFSEEKLRAFSTDYLYKLGSETFTRLGYDFSAIESVVGSIFKNLEKSNLNLDRQFTNSYRLSAQSSLKLQYDELIISLKDSTPDKMVNGINRFLSINPGYAEAHNDLGVLYSSIEEHEKALKHYHKAVSLNTNNIVFQKNLADFLFIVMSDIPGALEIYARLLEYNQKDIETLYAIGQISFKCGKIDDAKSFFNRILVLSPGHIDASQALATIRNAGHGAERSNSELPSSRSNSKNNIGIFSSSDTRPGNENILIATSLAPHAIELQRKAVKSWLKLGFEVVSLNSPEEITVLKDKFPCITFHAVKRNGKKRFGKPYVYFDDFLRFFQTKDYAVYGIVNSDIHLKANKTICSFLKSEAVGSLIYGSRLDVHNLENFQGDFYLNGFDFFFFDRSILGIYPESIVSIGVTWWDYWAVLIPALNNVTIKNIITPFAYHVKHENRWNPKQWHYVGRHISNYLKDQDSANTQRRPPASNYSVFYEMLQNCVSLKCIDKSYSGRARRCIAYEDLFALNICILDFLDYLSQKTVLPWDNFLNSRSNRSKGSNFYSSISTADTNDNVPNFRSEAFQNCSRLYNRAMRLYRADKPDAAEKVLKEITVVLPGYPPASNHLGVMHWEQGSREKALEYFNAAFRYDPYDRSTVINCATAMIHSGKSKEARQLYAAYLRTNPGDLELGNWQRKLETKDVNGLPLEFSLHSKQDLLELPVLVYQMGKVGSTSIIKSLEQYGIPSKHAHTLSWSGIEHAEALFSKNSKSALPVWIRYYRGIRAEIDRLSDSGHWKIITLVRDPLRRYISELFQNFNRYFPDIRNFNNCDVSAIRDHIQQYLESFDEKKDHACCWFDNELKEVFGIDVFSKPFDTNRGYQQYSTERANVLLLRLENLSSCASEALEPFLSFSPFKLIDSNVSATKPYAKIYNQLLSNLIIDRSLLDRFYNNRLAKHFYSESEIETFKKEWSSPQAQTTISTPQNQYRVSAVVSTFSSEKFIEGRLQNLINQSLFKKNKLEVIVVDSNSPENERSIVEKYASKHPNISYCRTPERETVYKAWNRGIDMARGTYFVNANTDDRFASNALEVMADYLDAHSEYDAAYGNWMVTRTPNDTFESDTIKRFFEYPEFHPGLFFYLQITSHANFIRRSVFAKIGNFNSSYTVFGDREFMFRFASAGHRAIKLNNTVGLYLENPTSIEHANKDIGLKECAVLYDDYLNPACFSNLMGHVDEPSPKTLSKDYTKVGCFGMDLYRVDGKSIHALGSPAKLFAKAIELDPYNVEALNNMGVIAMHRKASQDAVRFFNNARNIALDVQKKVIDHNLGLTRCGISSPDQLRFIFPSDFLPITINNVKYQNTGRNRKPIATKSSKIRSNVSTATKRRTKKQGSKSQLRSKPFKETSFSSISPVLRNVWQDYLRDNLSDARRSLLHYLEENPEDWQSYELLVDIMLQSGKETEICAQLRPLEKPFQPSCTNTVFDWQRIRSHRRFFKG